MKYCIVRCQCDPEDTLELHRLVTGSVGVQWHTGDRIVLARVDAEALRDWLNRFLEEPV